MTNPSKKKGTEAESAVVRFCREVGWPDAERLALAGSQDKGDVRLSRHVILEVKAGRQAQTASLTQIDAWLAETERERVAAGAQVGVLVVQRRGLGLLRVGLWDAHLDLGTLAAGKPNRMFGTVRLQVALMLLHPRWIA